VSDEPTPDVDLDAYERSLLRRQKLFAVIAIGVGSAFAGLGLLTGVLGMRHGAGGLGIRNLALTAFLGGSAIAWGVTRWRAVRVQSADLDERIRAARRP
jgi:hypothetical protein